MKRVLLSYLLLQLGLITFLISCNEDSDELPIEIELVTLNSTFEPTSVFSQGDKIYFALKIKNNSAQDIVWYNYCELFQSDNLYTVYKLVDSKNQTYNYIGKPLSPPVDCNDIPVVLSVGGGYYFSVPWDKYTETPPLDSGSYTCKFVIDVKVNDSKKISKSFTSIFQVK
jgi:hypothetical protein